MRPDTYKGRFFSADVDKNNIKTLELEGFCPRLPVVDEPFLFYGKPLNGGADAQIVHTSEVTRLLFQGDGEVMFETANSVYTLKWQLT